MSSKFHLSPTQDFKQTHTSCSVGPLRNQYPSCSLQWNARSSKLYVPEIPPSVIYKLEMTRYPTVHTSRFLTKRSRQSRQSTAKLFRKITPKRPALSPSQHTYSKVRPPLSHAYTYQQNSRVIKHNRTYRTRTECPCTPQKNNKKQNNISNKKKNKKISQPITLPYYPHPPSLQLTRTVFEPLHVLLSPMLTSPCAHSTIF